MPTSPKMSLLETIASPEDLKKLDAAGRRELQQRGVGALEVSHHTCRQNQLRQTGKGQMANHHGGNGDA